MSAGGPLGCMSRFSLTEETRSRNLRSTLFITSVKKTDISALFLRPERRVQASQLAPRAGRGHRERGEALSGGRSAGGDEPDAVGDADFGGGTIFRWDMGRFWRGGWIW